MILLRLQSKLPLSILVHAKLRKEIDGLIAPRFVRGVLLEDFRDVFPKNSGVVPI